MLSKLAYLTLCRSIQLLALAARGDAVKGEGCVRSDVAYELPVRVHGSVW